MSPCSNTIHPAHWHWFALQNTPPKKSLTPSDEPIKEEVLNGVANNTIEVSMNTSRPCEIHEQMLLTSHAMF